MALNEEDRKTIVKLEMAKAHRFFQQAEEQRANEVWDLVFNRYYYACFHIVQALFIQNGLSSKTHAGMICVLSDNFIKNGKLPYELGKFISVLMSLRQKADYNCSFDLTQKDINMATTQTPLFIKAIEGLITPYE